MKNLFKKSMLFAAAAMAFVSCSNDATEDVINGPSFKVEVNAVTTDSRSAFGELNGDKYPTLWEGNESWFVGVNNAYTEDVNTITFSEDKKSAKAMAAFSSEPVADNGTYTLYALSPSSAWSSYHFGNDYLRFYIARNIQTPTATSCDPASQVLFAKSEAMNSANSFNIGFEHFSAYAKFSFKNVAEGGVVSSVTVSAEDVNLAGRYAYTLSTGKLAELDRLEKSITLMTSSTENLWMAVAPVDVSGKKLTFTITTDKGLLSKEVTMPATAKFESGKVATFTVDMSGIEYPAVAGENWQLVTAVANVTAGEYIVVGPRTDGSTVAYLPSTTIGSSPSQKVINIPGLDLNSTDVITTTLVPEDARFTFTGTATAMTITNADGNYLYTTTGNNGLRVGTTKGTWVIASNPNSAKALTLKFDSTGRYVTMYNDQDWRCYTSVYEKYNGNTQNGEIYLYKKVTGDGGETPDVPATPVLEVNPATVEVAAAGGNAEFGYTVTNPAEGVSVVASTTANWISDFNYATAGKVTFTVAENTVAEAREAVITLAYTGAESKTVTVKQAAAEVGGGEGQTCTVTYTVATTSSCTTSGTAPQGSSASYSQTYATKEQLTAGNSATFTLKGYTGATITGMVLNMKSNANKGAGKFSVVAGSTTLAAISSATNFNAWYDNNSYGGTFRDINVVMTNDSYVVGNGENVVVKFEATTNSIYIHSITLKYTLGETPDVPATPVLEVNPATVEVAAAGGNAEFGYTVTNPAEGVSVMASTTANWISDFNYATAGKVTFTVAENTVAEAREAVITLAYSGAESKTVTVKQAAAEVGGGDEPGTSVVVLREEFDNTTTADSSTAINTSKFPNFSGATSKAFTSKYGGLKFGSSSAAGYITSKSLDLSSAFTVQIDACKYGSDTGNIVVTCGTQSQTIQNSELGAAGSFKTFTLTFAAATATSTVKIATSSKRAYIDNVVITRN